MIASPAQVMAEYLILEGFGPRPPTSNPWAVFFSFMPASPDNAICVYDGPAREDGRDHRTGKMVTHPGLVFRIRARNATDAYAKSWAIARRLDIINRYFLSIADYSYFIDAVSRNGDPVGLGQEVDGTRQLYVVNARVTLQETQI